MGIKLLKGLVGIIGLFFVVMGFRWIFTPEVPAVDFAVVAQGITGLSTLRADIGSLFLCTGIFSLLALFFSRYAPVLLFCSATLMGVAAFGRFVGFILDGVSQTTVTPFIAELVFLTAFSGLAYALSTNGQQPEEQSS